jgi:hypothetical protein
MRNLLLKPVKLAYENWKLPPEAKTARNQDRMGLPADDPGIDQSVSGAVEWLCRAQDSSKSEDSGVARHFSLMDGWSTSYPETTGYIIPTLIDYAVSTNDETLLARTRRMLDWLVAIQLPGGGYQGGLIDSTPVTPVTFNTGQILIGLASGVAQFGNQYKTAMIQAADCLVTTQDPDGCWRSQPTPFAAPGEKAYETHVAWGLFEAARVDNTRGYAEAAMANIHWALTSQKANGWFEKCCLVDPTRPLTHTLGYVLRGIVEAHRYSGDESLLAAAVKTADGLLNAIRIEDGFLPGRLNADWTDAVSWACLTGTVQIAYSWLYLYELTGKTLYRDAAYAGNHYVRRTVTTIGSDGTRGGIKGSFPIDGNYGRFEYLNWAAKFFIDANLLEKKIRKEDNSG